MLNANYLLSRVKHILPVPQGDRCMHEFVATAAKLKAERGISAMDIAKRLLDYGFHAPTVYFPLTVPEAMMIEPTETESKETLDAFAETLFRITEEAADTAARSAAHARRSAAPTKSRAARQPDRSSGRSEPPDMHQRTWCAIDRLPPDHRPARARRVEHGGRRSAAASTPPRTASPRCGSTSGASRRSRSGYFQRYADRKQHAASRDCAVVRRQTGGGAILHDRELTYSLALPASHPLTRQTGRALHNCPRGLHRGAYRRCIAGDAARHASNSRRTNPQPPHDARNRFSASSASRRATWSSSRGTDQSDRSTRRRNIARPSPIWKVLGSAQRRHRGAILQHGSLLLERVAGRPRAARVAATSPASSTIEPLIAAVTRQLTAARLGLRFTAGKCPPKLESKAAESDE